MLIKPALKNQTMKNTTCRCNFTCLAGYAQKTIVTDTVKPIKRK
jgi:hypothetical protein